MAVVEPASPKQMLLEIAEQLEIDTTTIEGKSVTIDLLRGAIASYLATHTAILVIDDGHLVEVKQRLWFKGLLKQRQPMAVFATNPPRQDLFLSLPPLALSRLPEFAIREIMTEAALELGLNLTTSELAGLQQKCGGNPALAQRVIQESYLGLSLEESASDAPGVYYDAAPLVLLVGAVVAIARYVSLGTANPQLYIIAGIGTSLFIPVSKILFRIPPDSRRIE